MDGAEGHCCLYRGQTLKGTGQAQNVVVYTILAWCFLLNGAVSRRDNCSVDVKIGRGNAVTAQGPWYSSGPVLFSVPYC